MDYTGARDGLHRSGEIGVALSVDHECKLSWSVVLLEYTWLSGASTRSVGWNYTYVYIYNCTVANLSTLCGRVLFSTFIVLVFHLLHGVSVMYSCYNECCFFFTALFPPKRTIVFGGALIRFRERIL